MIRYVLAVALTTAILGVGLAGVDYGAEVQGEREAATVVEAIDHAAVDLYTTGDPPVGPERPAQRRLDLEFPGGTHTSDSAAQLTFAPVETRNLTQVTYRVSGRSTQTVFIEAPLRQGESAQFDLAGYTGSVTVVLQLIETKDGSDVITLIVDQ